MLKNLYQVFVSVAKLAEMLQYIKVGSFNHRFQPYSPWEMNF